MTNSNDPKWLAAYNRLCLIKRERPEAWGEILSIRADLPLGRKVRSYDYEALEMAMDIYEGKHYQQYLLEDREYDDAIAAQDAMAKVMEG